MPKSCCVAYCTSNKLKNPDLRFYILPRRETEGERRALWLQAIRRQDVSGRLWDPTTRHVYVCSLHFITGFKKEDETHPDYTPSLFPNRGAHSSSEATNLKRLDLMRKNCCAVDVPSTVSDHADISSSAHPSDPQCRSVHAYSVDPAQHDHDYCKPARVKDVHDKMTQYNEIGNSLLRKESNALFYTGIALQVFNILVSTLGGYASDALTMSVQDQVLMTLMKLKTNRAIGDLSKQFGISQSMATRIISYWIDKLEEVLQPLIPWLPNETIQATMPEAFKKNFPNTTCVIHCCKSYVQNPQNLDSRGESSSHYNVTVKYIVAVAPCGLIMFISTAYGGRCTDKLVTMDSGVLDKLKHGDEIMAPSGSSIKDLLFFERGIRLIMPSNTAEERMTSTRDVERAIRRLKAYQILSQVVSNALAPKINKILRICSALANLR
ncbi:uncharacterized protein LOC119477784 [Sebastes umbrosus]|uniref:uncharacterized protein LOC119477784 n=1 Tax=Sebastes umbrosus TaxID=72105 RepID=UPI00189FAA4D|nr:uncharacterized protein LOC119477784 [Sebastes umbrosus]